MCVATRERDGWQVALEPPGEPATLLARLAARAAPGTAVVGFDLPIGLPRAYARLRGIERFTTFLASLDPADPFLEPALADELCLARPYYPRRPGGASRAFQARRIGVAQWRELLRHCDGRTLHRPAASCMFWTLGAQQCGKAALACWRDVLLPALRDGSDIALWPFDGALAELAHGRAVTIVETYPAECYRQIGLAARFTKTRIEGRRAQAAALRDAAIRLDADLAPGLAAELDAGFPAGVDHAFDAVVGCLALLAVVLGQRPEGVPDDPPVRSVEGWMVGLDAATILAG